MFEFYFLVDSLIMVSFTLFLNNKIFIQIIFFLET